MQRFGFQIVFQPHDSSFTAIARLLVTAEGRAIVEATSVDVDRPRTQACSNPQRTLRIACLDIGGKPVGRVVCNRDTFSLVRERNDDEHGAEDLFLRDAHIV